MFPEYLVKAIISNSNTAKHKITSQNVLMRTSWKLFQCKWIIIKCKLNLITSRYWQIKCNFTTDGCPCSYVSQEMFLYTLHRRRRRSRQFRKISANVDFFLLPFKYLLAKYLSAWSGRIHIVTLTDFRYIECKIILILQVTKSVCQLRTIWRFNDWTYFDGINTPTWVMY